MSDAAVLSKEEVDALLKASQDKGPELSTLIGNQDNPENIERGLAALKNITDSIRLEWEKTLSSFLRKKIYITTKSTQIIPASAILNDEHEACVYSLFKISSHEKTGIFITSLPLLHQTINLLYGGKINIEDKVIEHPGKVGVIAAEKLAQICLSGFANACLDYGNISFEIVKSTPFVNLLTSMNFDEQIYYVESTVIIDDSESTIKFMISTEFINEFFPAKKTIKHKEKDFWRSAINSQVSDSMVNVSIALPDVNMKMQEVMALKSGDTISITDPTLVYVSLNSIKLFRASAGQTNNNLVVKIIEQI